MKQDRINDRIQKLARIERMTRKDVNKTLDKARGRFGIGKSKVEETQKRMEAAEAELSAATEEYEKAKDELIELTDLARTMDLVGSGETRDRKGRRTFMIGGREHEVDISDINDIKCMPYRKKQESNDSDDAERKEKSFTADVSLADDDPDVAFASDIKRFR